MENRRPGRRQGSSRPSSRFNPITGEDYEEINQRKNTNSDNSNQLFEKVPALNLGNLEDRERHIPTRNNQHSQLEPRPASPSSTVSWGTVTPRSTARHFTYRDDLEDELSSLGIQAELMDNAAEADNLVDSQWVSAPYPYGQQQKMHDAENLEEKKRREKVEETVMLDQLSRAVISDPDQDSGRSGDLDRLYHQPGQARGAIRRLHQSKVRTSATSTEQLLSQRVRFAARILTRNAADAMRDLTGFFFFSENSLTIYEYKQLGKTAKALPLIQRGVYNHMIGRRRGMPYTLADIVEGKTLHFSVKGQTALPETARSKPLLSIRICQVDEDTKARIIFSGVRPSEQSEVWDRFHALSTEERQEIEILQSIQNKIRRQIQKRGVKTFTGLSSHFKRSDRSGDGLLDRYELVTALQEFHINLTQQEFDQVWLIVDVDGDGVLDYGEFLRSFLGSMSEYRKELVRKAFQKIDPIHHGVISMAQMIKFFNAAKHPWVRTGQTSEIHLTEQFLASWTHCQTKGEVTYPEFEDYYEGLSVSVADDAEFINILKNCWGL